MRVDPFYFPPSKGKYEVSPGLSALGSDFNNGKLDSLIFQFTDSFESYRKIKEESRKESLEKYYCDSNELHSEDRAEVCAYIIKSLVSESSNFTLQKHEGLSLLNCKLTQEIIAFDSDYSLIVDECEFQFSPPPKDLFDALAMQVQEDLAVWRVDSDPSNNSLALIHLSFPNHWSPETKVGKNFVEVHIPVASFSKMHPAVPNILKSLRDRGPFVRFAWGLATDTRLNHHPAPAQGFDRNQWLGRSFDSKSPKLNMRVERQTLHPFPGKSLFLFTIRTYFYSVAELSTNNRQNLIDAIENMTPEEAQYKGLEKSRSDIICYLKNLPI